MISIIVPVYNNPIELGKTLKSLANQSEKDFEVVVVDDGSTESVGPVLSRFEFRELDVTYYRIGHGGAPRARNFGFEKSKGDPVLFCDADMELIPEALSKMKKVLDEDERIDFAYSDFMFGWKKFHFWEFDPEKLKELNYLNTCSMVRREKVVKWDESLKKFQDWDFWLTIVENGGRGKWIPEVLMKANLEKGMMSKWLPNFVYRLSCLKLKSKKNYEHWKEIILRKHKIVN